MPLEPSLFDLAARLAATLIGGALIGWDRSARGHSAGLKTMILVALAACLSMIAANLLLPTQGKLPGSFATMDVMRLPLGVLTGVGFIGGGAIVKQRGDVTGVTTAATLWFVTMLGLCFGAGLFGLGLAAALLGLGVLRALPLVERGLSERICARWTLEWREEAFAVADVLAAVEASGAQLKGSTIMHAPVEGVARLSCELCCVTTARRFPPPPAIEALGRNNGVLRWEWRE